MAKASYLVETQLDRVLGWLANKLENDQPSNPIDYLISSLSDLKEKKSCCADVVSIKQIQNPNKRPSETFWPPELIDKALTIVVMGASGDLAMKKTFPAIFKLYAHGLLPFHTTVVGYARSKMKREDFIAKLTPYFSKSLKTSRDIIELKDSFLRRCQYVCGRYDSDESFQNFSHELSRLEAISGGPDSNRIFYYAVPPTVYTDVAQRSKNFLTTQSGYNRIILEKPFGFDIHSAQQLAEQLRKLYSEDQIYRMDHYLGKEIVRNLLSLRFANKVFSSVWNSACIANVQIIFKEDFGLEGRGGYFDKYGIVRDILQNHLLQVLTLIAMEKPKSLSADAIRDEKVQVLKYIRQLDLHECVFGQYSKSEDGSKQAYVDDEGVPKDSKTPTFATVVMWIDNDRWHGVPFVLRAGKALNERKTEVRIQFKNELHPFGAEAKRNELVMRVQPDEAIYLTMMSKTPGMADNSRLITTDLDLSYSSKFEVEIPDAYEGLIYEVICGHQGNFVRTDELIEAWKIFTPMLHDMESRQTQPILYPFGSRGPKESDELISRVGYRFQKAYSFESPYVVRGDVDTGISSP